VRVPGRSAWPVQTRARQRPPRIGERDWCERAIRARVAGAADDGHLLEVVDPDLSDAERRYAVPAGHEEVLRDEGSLDQMAPMAQLVAACVLPIRAAGPDPQERSTGGEPHCRLRTRERALPLPHATPRPGRPTTVRSSDAPTLSRSRGRSSETWESACSTLELTPTAALGDWQASSAGPARGDHRHHPHAPGANDVRQRRPAALTETTNP
jgi:hypothetical protein